MVERGIPVHATLELCEQAVALNLGAHYSAKRDSLAWAR